MDARGEEWFRFVRDLEYATDRGSNDAAAALITRAGDCVAKASLLVEGLVGCGLEARLVRWVYELPAWSGVHRLAYRYDLHTACQVRSDTGVWEFADPTYDAPLRAVGLPVNDWGRPQTPAFPPVGSVYVLGDPETTAELARISRAVVAGLRSCGADELATLGASFNAYLRAARSRE